MIVISCHGDECIVMTIHVSGCRHSDIYILVTCNSDAGIHDTVVVQELLKEMAQFQTLDSTHKSFKGRCGLIVRAVIFM